MKASETGLLRLTTCGAVDDGKSTLLGRLLLDAGAVYEDHLAALLQASAALRPENTGPDPSLLFDGLAAEREQGITIDVAYRYFTTANRKFIIADAPGHEAHTRNMATAASNADLAVVVIDTQKGMSAQTRRHIQIAGLVGVRAAILALNKMELVGYDEKRFASLQKEAAATCSTSGLTVIAAIPLSARDGDMVVTRSSLMTWYQGPTLLEALESAQPGSANESGAFRFPVQNVIKPHTLLGGRGYAGRVSSGSVHRGAVIRTAHGSANIVVARILTADGEQDSATTGQAVILTLQGEHDIARGDLLVDQANPPAMARKIEAHLIVLDDAGLNLGHRYELRCATKSTAAIVQSVEEAHSFDDQTMQSLGTHLPLNTIARCQLEFSRPIAIDRFRDHPHTGGFLLVDRATGTTVAAGMTQSAQETNVRAQGEAITATARRNLLGHGPAALWFTGLSGAGKSTIAGLVERKLYALGVHTFQLDGDNLRGGLNKDLGFGPEDRVENIRRAGEVARLFVESGVIVTCAFISPYHADRALVRELVGAERFLEIFVDAPLTACIARDPKGLYKRALAGEIAEFSGVSAPYEAPTAPDLRLETTAASPEDLAEQVVAMLRARGILA